MPLVWGLVAMPVYQLQRLAERESGKELENLAHAFAEEVNSSVGTIDLSLIGLREHWMRDRGTFREIVLRLQRHLDRHIAFQVAIVDARGQLVFSSIDPSAKPIDLSDRAHIRTHLEGIGDRLFISEPVLGRVSKQWSVQFTRPLYDDSGRLDGVIVLSVAPEYFSRFYDSMDIGEGAIITLVREGGTILARSPDAALGMGKVLRGPPYDRADRPATGTYSSRSRVDGVERLHAWRTLPKFRLIVVAGRSVDAVHARYETLYASYLTGGALISLLVALAGYFMLVRGRERACATRALRESEARWKSALEGSEVGVWDWDLATQMVQLSERSKELLGVDGERVPGTLAELTARVHPDDVVEVARSLQAHLDGETPRYEMEHRIRFGPDSWSWVLARGMVAARDTQGRPLRMIGTFADITERKHREASMQFQAQHDVLTGLPNRALFQDRLRQALARARRDKCQLAVLFLDLDKFKPINDTYGHKAGDVLLQKVARRVRRCLRESDTVARVGGDEFVVLLPQVAAEADAVKVAEGIRIAVERPYDVEGIRLEISACVGVATYPSNGEDPDELIKAADTAMYAAKASGRNTVRTHAGIPA